MKQLHSRKKTDPEGRKGREHLQPVSKKTKTTSAKKVELAVSLGKGGQGWDYRRRKRIVLVPHHLLRSSK